jgi:pimeloyl-ACP methyl ester carboxylesterase
MKFQLDNGYLVYERTGSGIPLLFIHGYPLSRKIWNPQMDGLSDIASIISVDMRGHGESYPFDGTYRMDLLAEDCHRLLVDLQVKSPVVVCGLSMGGYVIMALFRKYPELFRGMILTSTRSGADSSEAKANRDTGVKNVREHGVAFIVDNMLPKLVSPRTFASNMPLVNSIHAIMLETSVNGVVGALQGMRDRPDSTPLLSLIKCPTLIIHGADDQLISVTEAESMHQNLSGSRLVVIPEAGHLLNMEKPDLFNQAVHEFLLSLP